MNNRGPQVGGDSAAASGGGGASALREIEIRVWRQAGQDESGRFETHKVVAAPNLSLLDLLDRLNAQLVAAGSEPVEYESDCREGICGACGVTVDGVPHGPLPNKPSCLQHVRSLPDQVTIEPLRSAAFPVLRDLVIDRSALTDAFALGGAVAIDVGTAPDADALPVGYQVAEEALDFAACIGCGACVAACPNGSAQLFAGAKLAHLSRLPQGRVERGRRARAMLAAMDAQFGPCSSYGECVPACPAGIDMRAIAAFQQEGIRAMWRSR